MDQLPTSFASVRGSDSFRGPPRGRSSAPGGSHSGGGGAPRGGASNDRGKCRGGKFARAKSGAGGGGRGRGQGRGRGAAYPHQGQQQHHHHHQASFGSSDPSLDPDLRPAHPHPGYFQHSFVENPWADLEAKPAIPPSQKPNPAQSQEGAAES
ncbi:hypothetical protein ACQY0O_008026 [Thecaphora frezii]